MNDTSDKKPEMLPLAVSGRGDVLGLVRDEHGVRPTTFKPIEEGKPILGDLVTFQPREGSPIVDLEVTRMPGVPRPEETHRGGPARVTTDAYRDGWERVFGRSAVAGEA